MIRFAFEERLFLLADEVLAGRPREGDGSERRHARGDGARCPRLPFRCTKTTCMPRARSSTFAQEGAHGDGAATRCHRARLSFHSDLQGLHGRKRGLGGQAPEPGDSGSPLAARLAPPSQPCPTPAFASQVRLPRYVEVVNMDAAVKQQMQKLRSVRLCPPTPGQVLLDVAASPPAPSDPSFAQFQAVRARAAGVAAPRPGLA